MQYKNEYDAHFKILLIGDSRVGKSSLLQRLVGELDLDGYCPTPGIDQKITFLSFFNERIKLRIWDAGGAPVIAPIVKKYTPDADGVLICFDLTNPRSFYHVKDHVEKLKETKKNFPIILIGCKSDMGEERLVGDQEIKKLTDQLAIPYFETSSYKGTKIREPFIQIMQKMYFLSALDKIKSVLQKHFNDYLKSFHTSTPGLFANRASKRHILLEHEFQKAFDQLFQATTVIELEDFFRKSFDIIKREDIAFAEENPMLSVVSTSSLSKTIKKIVVDLGKVTNNFINISELNNLIAAELALTV